MHNRYNPLTHNMTMGHLRALRSSSPANASCSRRLRVPTLQHNEHPHQPQTRFSVRHHSLASRTGTDGDGAVCTAAAGWWSGGLVVNHRWLRYDSSSRWDPKRQPFRTATVASSHRSPGSAAGRKGVRGVQGMGVVFDHLGGADGWDMVRGCPSTTAGRQGCWVLLTRP